MINFDKDVIVNIWINVFLSLLGGQCLEDSRIALYYFQFVVVEHLVKMKILSIVVDESAELWVPFHFAENSDPHSFPKGPYLFLFRQFDQVKVVTWIWWGDDVFFQSTAGFWENVVREK